MVSRCPVDDGLEVTPIDGNSDFASRQIHSRDAARQMLGLQRLARVFVEHPESILDQLVLAAVELCGADSAGISLEREDPTEERFYHWVATAGAYSNFFDAMLPRVPSACGLCLDRGAPQHFRVRQPFFDILGVKAPLVTDGILLPWQVEGTRGTIFIMAHDRTEAFDHQDSDLMCLLADFAAMGIRQAAQKERLRKQENLAAAAAMAHELAHRINNPLQSLTNILYLAAEGHNGEGARAVGSLALGHLQTLSALVSTLLSLPSLAEALPAAQTSRAHAPTSQPIRSQPTPEHSARQS